MSEAPETTGLEKTANGSESNAERVVSEKTDSNTLSDIGILKEALTKLGIAYSTRINKEYEYLFIGERRDIHSMTGNKFNDFFDDDLELLLRRHSYYEFEDGNLVSQPFNSYM